MAYETLLVEKSEAVATVTLNRPAKRNAISGQMLADFLQLFAELRTDLDTRFVIFTGGGTAFSAGADLTQTMAGESTAPPQDMMRLQQLSGHDFIRNLENLEQITIAAVNGYCLGAGLVLAMGCDFRIASENARFGVPETNIGMFFTWGSTPRLTSLIGPAKAKEMIMTCDQIDAQEALRIGLANRVIPPEQLMDAVHEFIDKIASKGPLATRMTKKLVNAATAANFGDVYICEPELVERLALSPEPMEGISAFIEKRKPNFSGR